jgi:hypothetical protein
VTWIIAFYWLVAGLWLFFSLMETDARSIPFGAFLFSMLFGGVFAPAVALKRVLR